MLIGGGWLAEPLGLPVAWSVAFGIAMLGGAASLGLIAGYPQIPARLGGTVVAGNSVFCVALLVLAVADVLPLTAAGTAFLVLGAVIVAVFAVAEFRGLRRSLILRSR